MFFATLAPNTFDTLRPPLKRHYSSASIIRELDAIVAQPSPKRVQMRPCEDQAAPAEIVAKQSAWSKFKGRTLNALTSCLSCGSVG